MDFKEIKEEFGDCDWMRAFLNGYTVDAVLWLMNRVEELEEARKWTYLDTAIKLSDMQYFKLYNNKEIKMNKFKKYTRKGFSEMRPYIQDEDLNNIAVAAVDTPEDGGMIARNPKNHKDQWYVAKQYFEDNLELVEEFKEGFYYLKNSNETEPTLVHGYHCTDLDGAFVFGFNTHDGGGLLPLSDLTTDTKVVPVEINESKL